MEKIIAVIVSYNRHTQLVQCIEALRNQTRQPDEILVVNNGSTDYTSVWLDKQTDVVQFYQENVGSAGGYHAGIKWAYDQGYTWIWCMDDDSYPRYDALEMLMEYRGEGLSLLNSAVLNRADKKTFVWKMKSYKTIDEVEEDVINGVCHPFNGALIHQKIVAQVGLPKSNLFFWGEGSEYYYRIVKQHKIAAKTITKSIQYHPAHCYEIRAEWNYATSWKMYFYVRNRFQVLQTKMGNTVFALVAYLCFVLAFCGVILFYQKTNKLKKMAFAFSPMVHALTGNYVATADSVIEGLKSSQKKTVLATMLSKLRKRMLSIFVPSFGENPGAATI